MTKVIALFNQSGGVGKSTLTMNLGYHLALFGNRVLLIDMDPQSTLTCFMGLDPVDLKKTIYDTIVGEQALFIQPSIHKMDIVPTNLALSRAEIELVNAYLRDFRLRDPVQDICQNYDFILIDCPPSLGLLSYISLMAATHILVPIQTQYKSFYGTQWLLKTYEDIRRKPNPSLKIAGFIPTLYDRRNSQDYSTLEAISQQLSHLAPVFPPIIRTTVFADASQFHEPLAVFSPNHKASQSLETIANKLDQL